MTWLKLNVNKVIVAIDNASAVITIHVKDLPKPYPSGEIESYLALKCHTSTYKSILEKMDIKKYTVVNQNEIF